MYFLLISEITNSSCFKIVYTVAPENTFTPLPHSPSLPISTKGLEIQVGWGDPQNPKHLMRSMKLVEEGGGGRWSGGP